MKSIETLNFFIGGFGGGYERIIWQNNKLHHQLFNHAYPEDIEVMPDEVLIETAPLPKEWEEFWKTIDELKIWNWDKEYFNKHIMDGTQWELKIKRQGRRRRRIFGSNAYPEPNGTFTNFIKALNRLSNSNIEFEED